MKVRITKVPDKKNESLNASKWHADGGLIDRIGAVYGDDPEKILLAIQNARARQKK